ncbi:restriction endonuclease subunit S [Alishewanella sp. 16-MA]|uniref:Restriction endonuclease subunit S n=1 Tax=Alishewanella maricola TaxID=2795740 RepID=A0ABS8C2T9_9ALTE|nr:restriction endonuclease subunit S [Alishewanella maricola]
MNNSFPEHWDVLPFTEAIRDATSEYSKIQKSEYNETGLFPIVDQGQQKYGGFTDDSSMVSLDSYPAIVFGDHTRIFKFINEPFCLGADGAKVLEPKVKLDKKFLFYYLSSLRIESAGYSRHYKFLKENLVPLPPLAEQKRIAEILDKADAIRRQRQQAIQLADDFLRAVFLKMFGDPVTNPKKWEVKSLSTLCSKITDGTHHSPPIVDVGVPYITAKHLKTTGLEFYKDPWFISEESHKAIFSRCAPEKYDVLYIKDGATTGLAAINEYDFEFSMLSSLALLKPNKELMLPEFLCMFLNHPRSKLVITANMAGAAITRLTLAKIKDIQIPLPEVTKQKVFSEIYWKVKEFLSKTRESEQHTAEEFNALSQKAFSGQL